jgi:hypothetical protein
MANEITVSASLSCYKPSAMSSAIGRTIQNAIFNMSGVDYTQGSITVATSPGTTVPLGLVTTPHWAYFENLDTVNYLVLQNGAGGAVFGRLYPGEGSAFPLDPTCVPYAIANTAAVQLDYLIISL